jgi:ABC-2 type transport system permease protein
VFIEAGRIVATGTPAELKARTGQAQFALIAASDADVLRPAIAAGYAVGFRPAAGPAGWAAAVAVFLLVTLALSLLAALIGLVGRSPEVAQQLAAVIIIPIFFSSAFVPTATMPSWLRVVTASQPVTQAVDTLRALLLHQPPGRHLWLTLTEFGALTAVAFTLTAVLFNRIRRV